ncbi:MAG: tetratricopeptide repeat protein [Deltaproteobacteria bacterium]|nr:tetratricopeptide repeat protein [Deltaproteobacteria bacterium]
METNKNMAYEILKKNPSPDTILILLRKLKDKGKLRLVIQECNKALDIFPNELRLRQLLAETYIETGQITQAESQLETMSMLLRDFIKSFKSLAEIFAKQGRNKEAIDYLEIYSVHRHDDYEASQLLNSLKYPIESFDHEAYSTPVMPPEPDSETDHWKSGVLKKDIDTEKTNKEKMIGILESWREKIVENHVKSKSYHESAG